MVSAGSARSAVIDIREGDWKAYLHFTGKCRSDLEHADKSQRYGRYPWLEALMNILAAIERIQDEITLGSNVIAPVPATK